MSQHLPKLCWEFQCRAGNSGFFGFCVHLIPSFLTEHSRMCPSDREIVGINQSHALQSPAAAVGLWAGLGCAGTGPGKPQGGKFEDFFVPNNHLLLKSNISIVCHPCLSPAMSEIKEERNGFLSTSRMSKPTILGLNESTGFNWAELRRDSLTGWKIVEWGSPSPKIFCNQCFLGSRSRFWDHCHHSVYQDERKWTWWLMADSQFCDSMWWFPFIYILYI